MKINFTKREYLMLLDLMYMADWMVHAHSEEPFRSDTKEYYNLMQKIMSYAKEMACEDLVEYNKENKTYLPSFVFEKESNVLDYIEEFEEDSFWSKLISKLSERDTLKLCQANNLSDITLEKRNIELSNAEQKWSEEFEKFDLDRLCIDQANTHE